MPQEHKRITDAIINGHKEEANYEAFIHIEKLKDMIIHDDSFK